MKIAKSIPKSIVWVGAAAAASWATWLWLWPLGLAAAVPLVALAGRGGKKAALLTIGTSPFVLVPVFGFGMGVVDFARGRAALVYPGLVTAESNNLHPRYRVPEQRTGRVEEGREAFYRLARNAAIHCLGSAFGPTSKAYNGPYPSREAAWNLLETASGASVFGQELLIHAAYRRVPIGGLAAELERRDPRRLRAAMSGETLIVGVPNELWLVDSVRGQPFAHWVHARVRVTWANEIDATHDTVETSDVSDDLAELP